MSANFCTSCGTIQPKGPPLKRQDAMGPNEMDETMEMHVDNEDGETKGQQQQQEEPVTPVIPGPQPAELDYDPVTDEGRFYSLIGPLSVDSQIGRKALEVIAAHLLEVQDRVSFEGDHLTVVNHRISEPLTTKLIMQKFWKSFRHLEWTKNITFQCNLGLLLLKIPIPRFTDPTNQYFYPSNNTSLIPSGRFYISSNIQRSVLS